MWSWFKKKEQKRPEMKEAKKPLTFRLLQRRNKERCIAKQGSLDNWSLQDWCCALAGEAGELCNWAKKVRRLNGKNPTKEIKLLLEAKKELADIVIYADLIASSLGDSLDRLIIEKFNEKSDDWKMDIKL